MPNNAPIGIFDSGLGGLTVLKEIIKLLPEEDTIYLGDTARVPYGIRSPEVIMRYSFENTRFLLSREIKILVIACNTASAISLEKLKESIRIPVIGVIEPGAKAALAVSKSGRIGVIGTEATVKSGIYSKVIKMIDPSKEVHSVPCPLFVPLVEEGWTDNQVAHMTAEIYLDPMKNGLVDTLLLGCTHYPLLKKTIGTIMGREVVLIDSARETAHELKGLLEREGLLGKKQGKPVREFYSTDSPAKFKSLGGRFLGNGDIEKVNLMEVWDEARWAKK